MDGWMDIGTPRSIKLDASLVVVLLLAVPGVVGVVVVASGCRWLYRQKQIKGKRRTNETSLN